VSVLLLVLASHARLYGLVSVSMCRWIGVNQWRLIKQTDVKRHLTCQQRQKTNNKKKDKLKYTESHLSPPVLVLGKIRFKRRNALHVQGKSTQWTRDSDSPTGTTNTFKIQARQLKPTIPRFQNPTYKLYVHFVH